MRYPLSFTQVSAAALLGLVTVLAGAQAAPETAQSKAWQAKLLTSHASKTGCSEAVFPAATWKDIDCGTPAAVKPLAQVNRPLVIKALDEAHTGDYALVSTSAIHSASGYLRNVENVTSVVGFGNVPDEFNLQINTESNLPRTAPGSLCQQSSNPDCTGWLQFVYDSGGSINIQSWALNFAPTCPASLPLTGPQFSCGIRTASLALPTPLLKFAGLAGAVLTGQVFKDASGNVFDEISLTVGGHAYKTNQSKDITGAFGNWKTAEFNAFGNSHGDESVFSSGSLLSVLLTVANDPGTTSCTGPGAGDTGETTNLTLTPCTSGDASINFIEGVAPIIQSTNPATGSASGGTLVTITAATTTSNGTSVLNGFTPNAVVMFGANRATVKSCTQTTCLVESPEGDGSVDITVANVFQNGSMLGPFSDPSQSLNFAQKFQYLAPAGCKLTLLGCPPEGGTQQYEVTCPTTVRFLLDGEPVKTGTFFLGQEQGANVTLAISACAATTPNCKVFTTQATMNCPLHPPKPPPAVYPNCQVCEDRMQQCVAVPRGFVCKGIIQ